MYPENQPQPQQVLTPPPSDTPDWLLPSQNSVLVKPPRKSKKWLILGVFVVLLLIAGAAVFLYKTVWNTQTCLTTSDYATLSGEVPPAEAPFNPTIDFYGFDVNFAPNTHTYAEETTLSQLKSIGTLRQQHPGISMVISLEAMYEVKDANSTESLVKQRIDAIIASLIDAGMKPEQISSHVKQYIDDPYRESFADTDIVTLSLTSATACR